MIGRTVRSFEKRTFNPSRIDILISIRLGGTSTRDGSFESVSAPTSIFLLKHVRACFQLIRALAIFESNTNGLKVIIMRRRLSIAAVFVCSSFFASIGSSAAPTGHEKGIASVAYFPDGKRIATAGLDGIAKIWDVSSRKPTLDLIDPAKPDKKPREFLGIAISPDGSTVAAACSDKTVRLWDSQSGALLATIRGHGYDVTAVAFSRDGKTLASASRDNFVKLWDLAQIKGDRRFEPRIVLKGHSDSVWDVAFSHDGKSIATASTDMSIKLWNAADGRIKITLYGHVETVWSVAFSPDDKVLVSGSEDQTIRLWDALRGGLIQAIPNETRALCVAFSADGKTIAATRSPRNMQENATAPDAMIVLFDRSTFQEVGRLIGPIDSIRSVAFSPDGKTIAAAGLDRTITLWDSTTRSWRATLHGPVAQGHEDMAVMSHSGSIRAAAYSPDGRFIASGGDDSIVKLWDLSTRDEHYVFRGHTGAVRCTAISPDGKLIASAGDDRVIRLWNAETGEPAGVLKGHTATVRALAFQPGSTPLLLASAGDDATARLWDVASKTEKALLARHTSAVNALAFSPNGETLATGSNDTTIKLWNVPAKIDHEIATLEGHEAAVTALAFTRDGKKLVSSGRDTRAIVWNLEKNPIPIKTKNHFGATNPDTRTSIAITPEDKSFIIAINGSLEQYNIKIAEREATDSTVTNERAMHVILISPDGKDIALAGDDRKISIKKLDDLFQMRKKSENGVTVSSIAGSTEASIVATGQLENAIIQLWNVDSRRQTDWLKGNQTSVHKLVFSPSGKLLASATGQGEIKIWRLDKKAEKTAAIEPIPRISSMSFSPDDRTLAVCAESPEISLLGVNSERQVKKLEDPAKTKVRSVAFSPDGKTLASAGDDRVVKLWDVATSKVRLTLTGHVKEVTSVAFSPDGSTIASASLDRRIGLWDVDTGRLVGTIRGARRGILELAYSPSGNMLASRSIGEPTIDLYDLSEKRLTRRIILPAEARRRGERTFRGFAFAGKNDRVVTPDGDSFRSWDTSATSPEVVAVPVPPEGNQKFLYEGHQDVVRSVAFNHDASHLFTRSDDHMVKAWDPRLGSLITTTNAFLNDTSFEAISSALAGNGTVDWYAAGNNKGNILIISINNGIIVSSNKNQVASDKSVIRSIAIARDGKKIAAAIHPEGVKFFKRDGFALSTIHSGRVGANVEVEQAGAGRTENAINTPARVPNGTNSQIGEPEYVVFSPDGSTLASASRNGEVGLWDVATEKRRSTLTHGAAITNLAFSPTSKILAVSTRESSLESRDDRRSLKASIVLWDVATGERVGTLSSPSGSIERIAFSPNGERIAGVGVELGVVVWDVESRGIVYEIPVQSDGQKAAHALAYSPDGKRLAIGDDLGPVRVLNAADGSEVAVLSGHRDRVEAVTFSADGKLIATASRDTTARVWDAPK